MVGAKSDRILSNSRVDLSRMPPPRCSLRPHRERVNYRVAEWKHSHINNFNRPSPTNHGWKLVNDLLEPIWSDAPTLPACLLDLYPKESEVIGDSDSDTDAEDDPDTELTDDELSSEED